ncbi:MAG: flavodoxin family protein [Firmicutes bacterium]|nr:flavodoxin family protein [Bacillota bacterium]
MKIYLFSGSPNADGLTAACCRAAEAGAKKAGAETVWINLNAVKVGRCLACGNGWGTCRDEHVCTGIEDDFQKLHRELQEADGIVIVTPVYWGGLSEATASFFERLRRCEAFKEHLPGKHSILHAKPAVAVAAAGGSGRGTVSCLVELERMLQHLGADIFDLFAVTRKSRPYKLAAIEAGIAEMAAAGKK